MYCIKFVTEDYLSPTRLYSKIDYSNFGVPIEVDNCDPKERGQYGKGIHVIPLVEDADSTGCPCSDKCIILEVDEKDIIYQKNNGKMRVKKATPLSDFDRNHPLWNIMLKNPEFAYLYAINVDKCANDDTRNAVLSNSYYAYLYALYADQCAREDTRNAVLSDIQYTYWYAKFIDKCGRDDTRNTVLSNDMYAYWYAKNVDQCARDDTRNAVLSNPKYAYYYALDIDKCARNDTRNASYENSCCKHQYIEEFGE
jgi:hypothetical protein